MGGQILKGRWRLNKLKKITDAVYEELHQLWIDKQRGRLLTPDGLLFICEANDNDPEKIGKHLLEVLSKYKSEKLIG